jgi:ABC-2 type transport system permease protein
MSSLSYAAADAITMTRRQLRHMMRYPVTIAVVVALPVVILLLFVFVFGGMLGAGLDAVAGGRSAYVDYVTPGIILLAIAGSAQGTCISVAMDTTQGIVARFRTMPIARASFLTGHVLGSTLQTMAGIVLVLAVAMAVGFRPNANAVEWLAALGLITLTTLAFTWLSVAFGLISKSVEGASNVLMPLMLLPFLGSGFVPTESMSAGVGWFAEYQPFTPVMETLRGLLLGAPIGRNGVLALAWTGAIGLVGYIWAKRLFDRPTAAAVR